ncbi:hypothetical protein [Fundicoccus culcitae]|uniref:Uncharacterized protein n=1 Tax=Fundicoccus culcitae TaxID=2969821 RepID=A0ABY5P550_9LACT|nr:hypothetical protein [Fundicoccus culcitae]UUX33674.1 hypothetical protein NRE15_12310 [Fundicoccus culcitae]
MREVGGLGGGLMAADGGQGSFESWLLFLFSWGELERVKSTHRDFQMTGFFKLLTILRYSTLFNFLPCNSSSMW